MSFQIGNRATHLTQNGQTPSPERGRAAGYAGAASGRLGSRAYALPRWVTSRKLDGPSRAVAEAFRVLQHPGLLLVRTVLPADAAARVPFRFVPTLAEAPLMPSLEEVVEWLRAAGFGQVRTRRVCRSKRLRVDEVEARLRREAGRRYAFLAQAELEEGLRRMQAAFARSPTRFVDPRPTWFVVAET
jgi:hypothetical protein